MSLHLHFNLPAEIRIAEGELLEPVPANGVEGGRGPCSARHGTGAEERSQLVTESLVRWESVALPLAQLARAYDQVGLVLSSLNAEIISATGSPM